MKKILTLLCVAALAVACNGKKNTETLTVASRLADCVGVAPQKCMLVKHAGSVGWEFMYGGIEGFDYVPGYEYVLKIRKETIENPPADHPSIRYILVKEVSRTRKTSENMPASVVTESTDN